MPIVGELEDRLSILAELTPDDVVPEFTPRALPAFQAFAARSGATGPPTPP